MPINKRYFLLSAVTFGSNQIREAMLTREEALELFNEENRPRYESLKWYLFRRNGLIELFYLSPK